MRYAILEFRLRSGHLVVGGEGQLVIGERKDSVRTPIHRVGVAATWLAPAAPLIGEQYFAPIVTEISRMPVGVVRIVHCGNANRLDGIRNVKQNAVAGAGSSR